MASRYSHGRPTGVPITAILYRAKCKSAISPILQGAWLFRLALFGGYASNRSRECCVGCWIDRPMLDFSARRIIAKKVVAFPVLRRPDWSGHKTTTTVGADVSQNAIDAARAKRAFVGADARFDRIGRQCLVAVLACGSEFEHHSNPFRQATSKSRILPVRNTRGDARAKYPALMFGGLKQGLGRH